ncbi:HK97-gp10 family putative phage morphogenesis protein [Falsirhodobacter halotolerans]|uniref:HK97-gp10 family putative phage morphogenesis protein n=1 Tax=Falsirhodobacter halotolerans TaxID=1146892 RepID=UPI001FD0B05A|nr:HK97-gp10 family putative phage morphogenesis protein [Falsirhodobacter halotolerans]MCJ8138604.1 HK97 gp10 family phage protein [Falsirhodobacter halotolerans]
MAKLSPRITAKLKRIPSIAVDAAKDAMEEGAQMIVDHMRQLAPKGRTGKLAQSIGWTWGDLPPGTFMIDEVRSGGNKGDQYATLRIKIYAGSKDAFYARFVEFGTAPGTKGDRVSGRENDVNQSAAGRKVYRTHPGTPAQPFFYPGWKAKKAEFRKLIRQRVRAAIKKEFARG